MYDFMSTVLQKVVPFIIPAIIVYSFYVNSVKPNSKENGKSKSKPENSTPADKESAVNNHS